MADRLAGGAFQEEAGGEGDVPNLGQPVFQAGCLGAGHSGGVGGGPAMMLVLLVLVMLLVFLFVLLLTWVVVLLMLLLMLLLPVVPSLLCGAWCDFYEI